MIKERVMFNGTVNFMIGKIFLVTLFPVLFYGCDSEDSPDCFKSPGKTVTRELVTEAFQEVMVYGRIKLYIEQGEEQKILIESGKNLIEEVNAEVENGRLNLKRLSDCSFFRETHVTKVYITVPDLTFIINASNKTIESVGVLKFPEISLRSNNNQHNPEIYTNGDFRLHLVSDRILLDGDDYANFYLSGSTKFFKATFWAGNGRLEAGDLSAETIVIFHRGTNKMIVNPGERIEGEIRSAGDVVSLNRPPVVNVKSFYTGKLIFQ